MFSTQICLHEEPQQKYTARITATVRTKQKFRAAVNQLPGTNQCAPDRNTKDEIECKRIKVYKSYFIEY